MLKAVILLALAMGTASQSLGAQETVKVKYERNVITRAEIQDRAPDVKTALEVVQRLRPHFLRERSQGAITTPLTTQGDRNPAAARSPVQLYVNGAKSGVATFSLQEIQAAAVVEILYLSASDATTRFGTGHDNGAILVRTGS